MSKPEEPSWTNKAAAVEFCASAVIDGARPDFSLDAHFRTVNPATGESITTFPDCGAEEVSLAVKAAARAFNSWAHWPPADRKKVLHRFADRVAASAEQLALRDTIEMGKPIMQSLAESSAAADFLRYYAELADKVEGEVACMDAATGLAITLLEPRGVIGVITPWNFPVLTAMSALAPALTAGNCVVQKPSEYSPSSALLLGELALEAGLPPGVLNIVPGTGERAGRALAQHPGVNKLHFTGSTRVGRQLMVYAGESNGKPVMLETGGKSPQIVFADAADVDGIAEALAMDVFNNSGQICVARTRLLVERSIADTLTERVLRATEEVFTLGHPLDEGVNLGPLVNLGQFRRVKEFLDTAREEAATVQTAKVAKRDLEGGYFQEPVVASGLSSESPLVQREIFGPVLSVLAFDGDDDALSQANDTEYGLAATVWTRDLQRGQRFARAINAGRVDIRCSDTGGASLAHLSAEPFGASGYGVLGGRRGLEPYLRHKGVQFLTG